MITLMVSGYRCWSMVMSIAKHTGSLRFCSATHTHGHKEEASATVFQFALRTRPGSHDLHSRAGHLRVRGPAAERLHGSSHQLPPHSSSSSFLLFFVSRGAGERAQSQSGSGLSPRALHGPLRPAGGLPLLPTQPPAPAAALAASPLR